MGRFETHHCKMVRKWSNYSSVITTILSGKGQHYSLAFIYFVLKEIDGLWLKHFDTKQAILPHIKANLPLQCWLKSVSTLLFLRPDFLLFLQFVTWELSCVCRPDSRKISPRKDLKLVEALFSYQPIIFLLFPSMATLFLT